MGVLHLTEAELASDLHAVLEQVRQGVEVVIEKDAQPIAVIRTPPLPGRTVSECLTIAQRREAARGSAAVLDPEFAADVDDIVNNRQPWSPPTWD